MADSAAVSMTRSARAQRLEQAPFGLDAVDQRPVGRQRMAAARFGVAAREGLVVAVEIQQPHVEALFAQKPVDGRDQRVDAEVARARIDTDGDRARMRRIGLGKDEAREQRERQVVDRFVAGVFERAHGGRAAGAGKTGHERDAPARCRGGLRGRDGQGNDHDAALPRARQCADSLP